MEFFNYSSCMLPHIFLFSWPILSVIAAAAAAAAVSSTVGFGCHLDNWHKLACHTLLTGE